jgi:hypothetical protein
MQCKKSKRKDISTGSTVNCGFFFCFKKLFTNEKLKIAFCCLLDGNVFSFEKNEKEQNH